MLERIFSSLSRPWFRPWKFPVSTKLDEHFNRRACVRGLKDAGFSSAITKEDIQILSGCPVGGIVYVERIDDEKVVLIVKHYKYIRNKNKNKNIVEINVTRKGLQLYLEYIWFNKKKCPDGFGAVAALHMLERAQALGFKEVKLLAAGGSGIKGNKWSEPYWGYSFWPSMGFDAPLHPVILKKIANHPTLHSSKYVSDIMHVMPDWWKEYGDGAEMTFNLDKTSGSWYKLKTYMRSKGYLL